MQNLQDISEVWRQAMAISIIICPVAASAMNPAAAVQCWFGALAPSLAMTYPNGSQTWLGNPASSSMILPTYSFFSSDFPVIFPLFKGDLASHMRYIIRRIAEKCHHPVVTLQPSCKSCEKHYHWCVRIKTSTVLTDSTMDSRDSQQKKKSFLP